ELMVPTFRNPLNILKLFLEIARVDLVYTWFAGTNAFFSALFSKLLRKKSLVVVGGYDAAYVPEINYGIFVSRWRRTLARFTYKHVDLVLVVDAFLKKNILINTRLKIAHKIVVVPTGYDASEWKPSDEAKEDLVLTVSAISELTIKRKGLDTFVKASTYLPHVKFVLVGKIVDDSIKQLKGAPGSNVLFTGYLSGKDLLHYYQRAKVYCQLSMYEGLPNALCEAMLCECIPVGTKHGGIPTAIGDVGFYVPYGNIEATVKAIREALNCNGKKGEAARERIKNHFPLKAREKKLTREIIALFSGKGTITSPKK
ncbi:MAG: glycosyltransferase family 4 protein, partial [Candidatus Bathycorpusculaceae bacterium]